MVSCQGVCEQYKKGMLSMVYQDSFFVYYIYESTHT